MNPEKDQLLQPGEKSKLLIQDLFRDISSLDGLPSCEVSFDLTSRYLASDILANVTGLKVFEVKMMLGEIWHGDVNGHLEKLFIAYQDAKRGEWASTKSLIQHNAEIIEKILPRNNPSEISSHFLMRKIAKISQQIPDIGQPFDLTLLK